MTETSVAIVRSDFHGHHTTSWSHVWLDACVEQGLAHELVDWRAMGAFERLVLHDVVLWHFSHYSSEEMKFARHILAALKAELHSYAKRMFSKGFRSRPNALLKVRSNLASSRTFAEIIKRLKRAPEFLFSWRNASRLGSESGYVYLQEFIPGVDHDLKIVVIGDQLSFICRAVRKNDFRASGGGSLFYDRSLITQELIKAAFNASDTLGSDCTGFDMVVDPRTQRPVIFEVSYGFSHTALLQAGGYFDRSGAWHDVPLNAPRALLQRMLTKARSS